MVILARARVVARTGVVARAGVAINSNKEGCGVLLS